MTNIKTAISIEGHLFKEIEALAGEMKVSRSHLFSLAASDFLQHRQNQKLLEAINAAYSDLPDREEESVRTQMKAKYRQIVDEW